LALLCTEKRLKPHGEEPWRWHQEVFNGYAHSTSRSNQYLATNWGSLTAIDLQTIKSSIVQRLALGPQLLDAEAILLVLGILTTGRSSDDWLASHVFPGFPAEDGQVLLHNDGFDWRWLLPLGKHVRDKQPSSEFLIQPHQHVQLASRTCDQLIDKYLLHLRNKLECPPGVGSGTTAFRIAQAHSRRSLMRDTR
jgi:hypothetical protein